jgi:hypothetical protein
LSTDPYLPRRGRDPNIAQVERPSQVRTRSEGRCGGCAPNLSGRLMTGLLAARPPPNRTGRTGRNRQTGRAAGRLRQQQRHGSRRHNLSTDTKPTLTQARKNSAAAESAHTEAIEAIHRAERHAEDLRQRNASGDGGVTGLDIASADAELELARDRAAYAGELAEEARTTEGHAIADKVADEVARKHTPANIDQEIERVRAVVTEALGDLVRLLRARDSASDDAGATLAAAGVPERTTVGRVRYAAVRSGFSGKALPGRYNVTIDGVRISNRDGFHSTSREAARLIQGIIAGALSTSGMCWGTSGVEAR